MASKKEVRYLQGTKEHTLTYRRVDKMEIKGYKGSELGGCLDDIKSTYGYIFMLVRDTYR